MDLFPEMFAGNTGLSSIQFAVGACDQTSAANTGVELFNPALTGTAQLLNAKLITLVGIEIWGAQAAAVNVDIWATTNSALVAGAATIAPQFMDSRQSTPLGVLKQGNLASVAAGFDANTTQNNRLVLAAAQVVPFKQPWNQDISPGTGVLITGSGTTRYVVSLIWIERQLTS